MRMITRRKILGWLGMAPAAAVAFHGDEMRAEQGPIVRFTALSELRSAWRHEMDGDRVYGAIRRCMGLRQLYREGRISRDEFQALLPHDLRDKCSHLYDLPWPDADDAEWNRDVTRKVNSWAKLRPSRDEIQF